MEDGPIYSNLTLTIMRLHYNADSLFIGEDVCAVVSTMWVLQNKRVNQ